jgi:Bacteriophage protein of unknown function (DUF646).
MSYTLKWYGDKVFTQITKANKRAMYKACRLVKDDIRASFKEKGDGRGFMGGVFGSPPAIRTGKLQKSIRYDVFVDSHSVNGYVGTRHKYGFYLERGTKKMPAHPFLVPSVVRNRRKINRIFTEVNS